MVRAVAIAVVLAGGLASTASAELRMAPAGSTPAQVSWPNPAPVTYSVKLTAVGREEVFALAFDQPWFTADRTGTAPGAASIRAVNQQPRVDGPATIGGRGGSIGLLAGCGSTFHGFAPEGWRWDVRLPADTTSTLSFDFTPSSAFPWPDTDFDVTFRAQPRLQNGALGTVPAVQKVTVPGPVPTGRRGVRLTLRSTPRTRSLSFGRRAQIRLGRRISVIGSTLPVLRHAPVSLFASTAPPRYFRRVATVRTDARGRFHAAIRARHTGLLEVQARIKPRSRRFGYDRSCSLAFDVRK